MSHRGAVPADTPGTTDHPVPADQVVDYTVPREGLPEVTDTPQALAAAVATLSRGSGPVAVDAERASGFRYGQDAYLVQLRRQAPWAAQEFEYVRTRPPRPAKIDPWRKTPRAGRAVRSPRSLAILRELWTAREQLAAELDRTPSKVLPHQALVAAAVARPTSRRKMNALKEFSSRQARQHQELWWRAIERAIQMPDDEDLPPARAPQGPQSLPQPRSWQRHHATPRRPRPWSWCAARCVSAPRPSGCPRSSSWPRRPSAAWHGTWA